MYVVIYVSVMKDISAYERPNTVSGLSAKRKELTKLLGKITAEAERVASVAVT